MKKTAVYARTPEHEELLFETIESHDIEIRIMRSRDALGDVLYIIYGSQKEIDRFISIYEGMKQQ